MTGDPLAADFRKRALRGHWSQFPVSPARVDVRLALIPSGQPDAEELRDWLGSGSRLRQRWAELTLAADGREPAERLAVLRACLTLLAELGREFPREPYCYGPAALHDDAFTKYYRVPWAESGIRLEAYVRDSVEFLVWCDDDRMAFPWDLFDGIPKQYGDVVAEVFRTLLAELERHNFAGARTRLLFEWATFIGCHARYQDFVPLAHVIGASCIPTLLMLAEHAVGEGRESLAHEVFSAANRPGPGQWEVEDACRGYLECDPLRCPAVVRPL